MNNSINSAHRLGGIGMALAGALLLSPDTLLMRLAEMDGYQMLAWRGLICVFIYLYIYKLGQSEGFWRGLKRLASGVGVLLILSQIANATLFCVGIAIAPASIVLFGVATVPIFAALFSVMIAGEQAPRALWPTICVVTIGIGYAIFGGEAGGLSFNATTFIGGMLGLGVAISIALSFVLIRLHSDIPFVLAIAVGVLLAGLFGLFMSGGDIGSSGNFLPIVVTGLIVLPVSFWLLSLSSRYTLPANVSLIMLLETILGPLWVWLGIGEAPTMPMMIGGGAVVLSLACYLRFGLRR